MSSSVQQSRRLIRHIRKLRLPHSPRRLSNQTFIRSYGSRAHKTRLRLYENIPRCAPQIRYRPLASNSLQRPRAFLKRSSNSDVCSERSAARFQSWYLVDGDVPLSKVFAPVFTEAENPRQWRSRCSAVTFCVAFGAYNVNALLFECSQLQPKTAYSASVLTKTRRFLSLVSCRNADVSTPQPHLLSPALTR